MFLAYPKKGNKRYNSYIHRDEIFPVLETKEQYVFNSDLKFNQVASLGDIFTVMTLKRTKKSVKKKSESSQKVSDYEKLVPEIEKILSNYPNELEFYQQLTPGYRRDWARFIFSAKQQTTRDKRTNQMVDVLSKGYKTMNLYKQAQK